MSKTRVAIILIIVLAFGTIGFLVLRNYVKLLSNTETNKNSKTHKTAKREVASHLKSKQDIRKHKKYPESRHGAFPTKEELLQNPDGTFVGTKGLISGGQYKYNTWWDTSDKTLFTHWYLVPTGTPSVQLRFFRSDHKGNREPCPVVKVYVRRFDGRQAKDTREYEIGSIQCEWENFRYSESVVVPVVRKYTGDHMALIMGKTYLLEIGYLDDGKKTWQKNYGVRIPDKISEKKMAVIDIDVTKKQDRWWERPQMLSIRVRQDILTSHLSLHVWNAEGSGGHPERLHLNSNGRAKIKLDQLGGDLRLANTKLPPPPAMQHRKFAFPVWYVKSITDRKITLPDDADIVIKPENAITSRLKLPTTKVPDGAVAIGLLADKDSHLSLAHARFQRDPTGIVELSCAPGMYRVVAYGPNSSAWGKPNAMRRVSDLLDPDDGVTDLGTVNITESDAGKTLEVQPAGK